ncbi:MAG: ABC transporter permease [Steroidobacteraceae bacterium]
MIQRIVLVAKREILTTVVRKGFLIGLLVMPVLIFALVTTLPRLMMARTPLVQGEVLIVDNSGAAAEALRGTLDPEAISQRRNDVRRRAASPTPAVFGGSRGPVAPPPPRLTLQLEPSSAELAALKAKLGAQVLALVVVDTDAVVAGDGEFGSYQLFVSSRLDEGTENTLHESLRLALVGARLRGAGLDPLAIERAMRVARPDAMLVSGDGEEPARRGFNRALPFVMGLLLFMGVMTGGQTLMTSTIEEKSSRVVEVLLAAASPLELMWGKLIGQLGIGLLIMAVYLALGVFTLFQFAMFGLLDPSLILYLLLFFLLSYLVYGTLMLVIGAAVNQQAEAQSLMGPVMILLIVPYVLSPMIGQAPNSAVSVGLSFLPPMNTFAMLARLASSTPPPLWQVLLSIGIAVGTACLVVWFAAKVYRVGLLMQGKPPNFATLIRWARQA